MINICTFGSQVLFFITIRKCSIPSCSSEYGEFKQVFHISYKPVSSIIFKSTPSPYITALDGALRYLSTPLFSLRNYEKLRQLENILSHAPVILTPKAALVTSPSSYAAINS